MSQFAALAYLISSVCFILALRGLSSPETARRGNMIGILGMAIAVLTTLALPSVFHFDRILPAILIGGGIGALIAFRIRMTALPQLVAFFHSLVGLAAVLVAAAAFLSPESFGLGAKGAIATASLIEMSLGAAIGAVTFTGSVVAFGKLQALFRSAPLIFTKQHLLNALLGLAILAATVLFVLSQDGVWLALLILLAFILGVLLIVPIGGADMPVVVSMLNSYSGWAACGIGFTLSNAGLIITGALVGSSGAILSYIMCKGMNRSIVNVMLGGFGGDASAASRVQADAPSRPVKAGSAEDAAFLLDNARSVIIVPGYGMAVAQAQHAVHEMAGLLKERGITIRYAIHPVAGRMPGHMNVLLAEAGVSYDDVFERDDINRDFAQTDVVLVIGANDVTNPAAKNDSASPIYGMPVLDVENAGTVLFVKRSLNPGYAGIDNVLFYKDNTMMLFGDAKKICETIVKALS